jgi:DNA replication and repair protein RecF
LKNIFRFFKTFIYMQLNRLSILNYKNIAQADLSFSPKINCFIGNNGMGKTNLLDAIYYLSFCKSFTNPADMQNIRHDADFFVLQGYYTRGKSAEEVYCGLKRRQKKQFKLNKKEYERLSDHIGFLPLVIISPADSTLVNEGSEERRRFLDSVISQYNKRYLSELIRYNKALLQRNTLLKGEVHDEMVYDIWEEQMAEAGNYIHEIRQSFIEEFIPIFQSRFQYITSGNEEVDIQYRSQLSTRDFGESLRQSRERDRMLGFTTVGIHKDDLEMLLGDYPIRRIGSQGQNKSFLVSMKFAQFDFLKRASGLTPLLLLDDIFDKLDAERVARIISLVSGDTFGQLFITDTNREHIDHLLADSSCEVKFFVVEKGEATT